MPNKKSYKQLQAELTEVLGRFENSAHQDIEDLLKDYEAGTRLIAQLEDFLKNAELSVKKIKS